MVCVLVSIAEGRGFDPRPVQTNDIKIGISCFFEKHAALKSKSKDYSVQRHNNVSGYKVYLRTVAFVN